MKKLILFSFIVLFGGLNIKAQDIDVYTKKKNDNYHLPKINSKMSFEEFQLLDKHLKMQDMLYAMVVPGYVHFQAKDKIVGYSLLGLRSLGFGGIYYVSKTTGITLPTLLSFSNLESYKREEKILLYSSALILTTYFFDWIHGKYRLEKKQNMIRYRYGMKINFTEISMLNTKNTFYGVSLHINL
jgi:hypothetical protein